MCQRRTVCILSPWASRGPGFSTTFLSEIRPKYFVHSTSFNYHLNSFCLLSGFPLRGPGTMRGPCMACACAAKEGPTCEHEANHLAADGHVRPAGGAQEAARNCTQASLCTRTDSGLPEHGCTDRLSFVGRAEALPFRKRPQMSQLSLEIRRRNCFLMGFLLFFLLI